MKNKLLTIVLLLLPIPVFAGQALTYDPCTVADPCVLDGDYISVGTGLYHWLAVKTDGSVVVGGGCECDGQRLCNVPEIISGIVKADGGWWHSIALKSDGSLVGWESGEIESVPSGSDYTDISTYYGHSLALKSDGTVVAWGWNTHGQCDVPAGEYIAIGTGGFHSLAIKTDNTLVAWGHNTSGQCDMPDANNIDAVAGGSSHSLALKLDGSLMAWGQNDYGQCNVPGGNDYVYIDAALHHSVAIKSDGTLIAWGDIGDLPSGSDFVMIATGDEIGIGLTSGATTTLTMQTSPADMNCVTPNIGQYSYYEGQQVFINATRCAKCPDVYDFNTWSGGITDPNSSMFITMDADKTIMANYDIDVRVCGDECHPIVAGDLDENCYVDFADFRLYADMWMECTHPDCD